MRALSFWAGKRVLLTGHTGFKGSWLTLWLNHLGAEVIGIALPPETKPDLFSLSNLESEVDSHICDIGDYNKLLTLVRLSQPEVVIHMAAQPLVRASYEDPIGTYTTNVLGTVHLLDALRTLDCVRVVLVVTTDKVYRNEEGLYPFRENDALGGHDPYSASKAAAEIVTASYRDAFLREKGIAVASARAGNVIGGGDWAPDRLIPDAIRAWQSDTTLRIRRPNAVRPWQHVLEPLSAYLRLSELLWTDPGLAGAFNFGPATSEALSVRDVISIAQASYGRGADVLFEDNEIGPHEAQWLSLETAKARSVLGINPRWDLKEGIDRSIAWYKKLSAGVDARTLCLDDIRAFAASGCVS